MIASNNADTPSSETLISTHSGREHGIASITFDIAENGVEGLVYNSRNGLFYVNLPQLGDDPGKGGVAVVDPVTASVATTLQISNCQGAGMALGPRRNLLLACATADAAAVTPLATQAIDNFSGAVTETIPQISGSDEAAYDLTTLTYFVAARNNPGGLVLGIVDARNNSFLGNVSTGKGGIRSPSPPSTTTPSSRSRPTRPTRPTSRAVSAFSASGASTAGPGSATPRRPWPRAIRNARAPAAWRTGTDPCCARPGS